ncbi:DUF5666 domain-containing protein [Thiomicrorhabdus lithotrophica]|uniref:DUF5666 domain-containing protein n=1 Tax=Thiomicrorhabdus lithotrophica TaxID=2949997 RepID=A0ABY8CDE4_9GAMM|nr:DUF5666 domain-containing protein [Thiomicrorhabdus lithotrophica]WEJ62685.1 DUF5666 domain-containing protein [Thiomicrorhabdus lithotrophica]
MFNRLHLSQALYLSASSIKSWLTILIFAFSVSACQILPTETQVAKNSGFGGTGKTADKTTQMASKSGFGGTGKVASNSGFGGTGIIGTITEFGSIWVNGIEVEYDKNVKIVSKVSDNDSLQLGQQVVVETDSSKKTPWTQTIHIFYPIAGQISEVKSDQIVVDGHSIYLNDKTKISEGLELKVGEMVAINGYPDGNNNWLATRVNPNPKAQSIYQVTPDFKFSNKVKHILIETTKPQLVEFNKSFTGLPFNLIESAGSSHKNSERYLLTADVNNGEITRYHLHKHKKAVLDQRHSNTSGFNDNPKLESNDLKQLQELKEVQELQNSQKAVLQNQVEQVKQVQDIKEQFQIINDVKGSLINKGN